MDPSPTQELDMAALAESKCTVIIPLFGYWTDAAGEQMTAEVLQVAMSRLKSSKHHLYFVFVSELDRLPTDVKNVVMGHQVAGNSVNIDPGPFSSYAQYIEAGLHAAREHTDSSFFIVYNPWILIREDGVDSIMARMNKGDVGMVSGFETRGLVEASAFDAYSFGIPKEERDLNIDFLCMTRQMSEIFTFDTEYKTHFFLSRDWWQSMFVRGYEICTSQYIPVYSFEVDWTLLEDIEDYEADKKHFIDKWKFDPAIAFRTLQ